MTLMPAPVPRPRAPAAAGASPRSPCRRRARCAVQHDAEPLHRRRVQPERRLVQQPKRGRDSASLASASRRRCPADSIRAGRSASSSSPTAASASRTTAAGQPRREPQVLGGGQPRLHRVLVPDIGHAPRMRRQIGQRIRAIPRQRPRRRPQQPRQQPQQRRFARPVRPGQQQRAARGAPRNPGRGTPAARRGTPPDPLPATQPLPALWTLADWCDLSPPPQGPLHNHCTCGTPPQLRRSTEGAAMKATGQDTLKTRRTLTVQGKSYDYFSLARGGEVAGRHIAAAGQPEGAAGERAALRGRHQLHGR